jgi:hypothetical protein
MNTASRWSALPKILLFLALSSIVSASHAAGLENNTDRLGMDARRVELSVDDPVFCQNECVGDTSCKSFTYVKPGLHGPHAVCYLMAGQPDPTPSTCCISGLRPEVTQAQEESVLYQAHQAFLAGQHPRLSKNGQHDTLAEYAKKCDDATGIHVPGFNCNVGTEVPGQGNGITCNFPNVLNGKCDPGSKFQVLPGGNADAVAVVHCRKVGLPPTGSLYNDIAIIQYNKKNGALCFYQALNNLPGSNIPAPLQADSKPWNPQTTAHWFTPAETEAIGCTGCHDNGGFVRSEYLAQLKTPPNALPSEDAGFDNFNTPEKYVGLDFETNLSWSVSVAKAQGDTGLACTSCHRLGVSNRKAGNPAIINGTAARFANIATAATQASKKKHSPTSPIWMRPGQITYDPLAEASATKFQTCAVGFFNSGFTAPPPGCTIKPLGVTWTPPTADNNSIWQYTGIPCSGSSCPSWLELDNNSLTVRIAASGGKLYQLYSNGTVWVYTGKPCLDGYCLGWQMLDSDPAIIGIFAGGSELYELHSSGIVRRYTGTPCNGSFKKPCPGWQMLSNSADTVTLAVDSGQLYRLQSTGEIWRYAGKPCGSISCPSSGWQMLDNNPATMSITAGGGKLYQLHDNGEIWRYTGTPCINNSCPGWEPMDVAPSAVAIVAGNQLYQLGNTGKIWRSDGSPCGPQFCGNGWDMLDNNPATINIAVDGDQLYQLHNTGKVWRFTGTSCSGASCPGWEMLGNSAKTGRIVAGGGTLYQLHSVRTPMARTRTCFDCR